jgi:hypothetical protein
MNLFVCHLVAASQPASLCTLLWIKRPDSRQNPGAAKPQPKFEPRNTPNTRKRELPTTAEPTAGRRAFMPRKGAEVAKSVEPLIFTTFRFIPRMKRCPDLWKKKMGVVEKGGGFPGNDFSATSAPLRGNTFPGAAMPRRADSRAKEAPD